VIKRPSESGAVSDLFGGDDFSIAVSLGKTEDCWVAACNLFTEIAKRHGDAEAKRIFRELGAPSGARRKRLAEMELRDFHEISQRQGRSIQSTARRIAEINRTLSRDERLGRGSTSEDALRQQIKRALKKPRGGTRPPKR
jgi:hypothetical protein